MKLNFQKSGFADYVCVADGTEIRLSCPSKKIIDPEPGMGKILAEYHEITKLNGEIIFYSPLHIGAHDQSH
jgi:hypothetical protein